MINIGTTRRRGIEKPRRLVYNVDISIVAINTNLQ